MARLDIALLRRFRADLGPRVWVFFIASIFTGLSWFLVESFFVYVLQAFMVSMGFVSIENTMLSKFPFLVSYALPALLLFGILRALAAFAKNFVAYLVFYHFVVEKRQYLFETGLRMAHLRGAGDIVSLFGETTSSAGLMIQFLSALLTSLFSACLFFAFGMRLAPFEMILGLIILVFFALPFRSIGRKIKTAGEGTSREWTEVNASLLSGLKNHFLLRIYRRTEKEIVDARARLQAYARHGIDNARAYSLLNVYPLMTGIIVITILTFVAQRVTHTGSAILVSFFYIFIRLSQSLSEASSNYSMFRFNLPAFQRLVAGTQSTPNQRVTQESPPESAGVIVRSLEFRNVSFGFPDAGYLFRDLSFSLRSGEQLAVVGASGSGKSTLLTLLFGLLTPTAGEILINGTPLAEIGTGYYESVGFVGPEPFIVEDSIRRNLTFGLLDPTSCSDDELWRALEICRLADEVRRLPGSLDYMLTEAHRLSTGQKQRLSIARAWLRKPSLVVLDEGTGNLDIQTEREIVSELEKTLPNSLFVFVTHRQELVGSADFTIRLTSNGMPE